MSVTVHQTPQAYSLIYNPNMFLALSNQIAQPNFVYRIVITDLISSNTRTYDVPADPDGYCRFNASPFGKILFEHYIPINTYGWQKATGIRKIRVNIGEYYGTTPAYTAGSNFDWVCWNGVEPVQDWCDFNYTNYLYDAPAVNYKYLSSQVNTLAFSDRSDYFYVQTAGAGDLKTLVIKTYDSSGTNIDFLKIDNLYEASTTYTDKYLCIDVGMKGLDNINPLQVNAVIGSFPITWSNISYYELCETNSTAPIPATRLIKTYTIGCEPRFPVYTIHFLRNNGAFQTVHFNKRSDRQTEVQRQTMGVYPYVRSGTTYEYSRSTAFKKTISSESVDSITLQTDWLTPDEFSLYKELIDSPVIYLDEGSALPYRVVTIRENSYKENKSYNEQLKNLALTFEFTNINYRQR